MSQDSSQTTRLFCGQSARYLDGRELGEKGADEAVRARRCNGAFKSASNVPMFAINVTVPSSPISAEAERGT